ncbi:hypothetical protein K523DRAFT_335664 [Schizophyllum commune Tattone D]|nr:hypothetical protein K523DRAFT_335664 [Schizophyllum commune Tattone D]
MSVDPPQRMYQPRALTKDVSMQYTPTLPHHDHSMDIIEEPMRRSPSFRGSLPPTSSFRMRMSATPQVEPVRESSMPPSLTDLNTNPTFVRAPSQGVESRQRLTPSNTLGTVAEQRHLFSPTKSRSSLSYVFTPQEIAPRAASGEAAQKALLELDAYKTPIIPSRRRKDTSDASALASTSRPTTGPDLFKKKRKFVPMNEEEQLALSLSGQGKKKKKSKDKEARANDTKPYSKPDGLKKLMTRHKAGEDPDASFESEGANELTRSDSQMDTSTGTTEKENKTNEQTVPDLPPQDNFAPRSADVPAQGSSLRIGRTKTSRQHLARPTIQRPLKKKFSAAFEDDDADDDMEERNQEIEKLNEIQAKAPPFKIDSNFFAKPPQAAPTSSDASKAKEPPVTSLPFSLGSLAPPAPKAPEPVKELATASASEKPAPAPFSFGAPPETDTPSASNGATSTSSSGGIPNFFSSSPALAKPLTLPTPSTPLFGSPAATPKLDDTVPLPGTPKPAAPPAYSFGTPAPAEPVKDPNSPFWVGSKTAAAPANGSAASNGLPSGSLFGAPKVDEPPKSAPATTFSFEKKDEAPKSAAPTAAPFSFGKPAEPSKPAENVGGLFGQPSTSNSSAGGLFGGAPAAPPATTAGFSFGAPAPSSTPKPEEAPKPAPFSFGAPAPAVEAPKPSTPFSFGQPAAASSDSAPKPLFGAPAPTEAPKPAFGAAPSVQAPKPLFGTAPSADAPKPLFGSAPSSPAPFSFGQPAKTDAPASSPFSFGAAPSTPKPEEKKPAFSFGAPAATPAAPAPFSFGSSTVAPAAVEAPKPFSFGAPAAARPSTPPKNDDDGMRMEESPTREITKAEPSKLTLNTGGASFSFGGSTGGFGSASSSTAPSNPFAFGAPAAAKPEENKPAFGGFGQPAQTGFSFGQSKPAEAAEPQRPATTGSFGFGASTPTSSASPFAFGTPSSSNNANPFGGASSQSGSAPNSPSTFHQPSPFSFGAPAPIQQSNSFSFGSQPASPAVPSATLPQPGTPSGGFGASNAFSVASPTSPFTSAPNSAGTDGGGLFTMGSASSNAPPAPGPGGRPVRRLPTRRKH